MLIEYLIEYTVLGVIDIFGSIGLGNVEIGSFERELRKSTRSNVNFKKPKIFLRRLVY